MIRRAAQPRPVGRPPYTQDLIAAALVAAEGRVVTTDELARSVYGVDTPTTRRAIWAAMHRIKTTHRHLRIERVTGYRARPVESAWEATS